MAYFDNNSTTCPFPEVLEAVNTAMDSCWANPSSPHRSGGQVRVLMEKAREELSQSFNIDPQKLTFTSGATESNNAILSWIAHQPSFQGKTVLVSAIEHPSILEASRYIFDNHIELIPVNQEGVVELGQVEELLKIKKPAFLSLLAAHNETGVLQPWREVAQICRENGVWFHCDATQWVGKLELEGLELCSSFSFSAHKFGGPKGVGGLFSREPIAWMHGGGQEHESRGGTENFPSIEGMRVAWRQTCQSMPEKSVIDGGKKKFEGEIIRNIPGVKIIGERVPRLWNTSYLLLPRFNNLNWVSKLDKMNFSLSTGSACSTARLEPSGFAHAIGLTHEEGRRLVRASSWIETREQDWIGLADAFAHAHAELIEDQDRSGVISL